MTESRARSIPKPRIESLSDLIFGLALSIGAISLVSNVNSITTDEMLISDVSVFGFSFLILIAVWIRYTRIMTVLPLENRWTLSLNTALLFTVSLEPFLFNVLKMNTILSEDFESQCYALDLGVMMIILASFMFVISDEDRKLIPADMTKESRVESVLMLVAGCAFLVSVFPFFWVPGPNGLHWRYYLWIAPLVISFLRRRTLTLMARVGRSKGT